MHQGLDDPLIMKRETNSLYEALKKYPHAKAKLIAWNVPSNFDLKQYKYIEIIPLWRFLLTQP